MAEAVRGFSVATRCETVEQFIDKFRDRSDETSIVVRQAVGDRREVVRDPEARYFGGRVEERSLVPLGEARLGRIGFDEWLRRSRAKA